MRSTVSDIPGLSFGEEREDEDETVEEEVYETFYLWDVNESLFKIYRVLCTYLKSLFISVADTSILIGYEIDSIVLIELIKAYNVDMIQALHDIPYIHSEYAALLIENSRESSDG